MFSEPRRGMAGISAEELFDVKQWQKIQDLFAEIIRANLWLINSQGNLLSANSKITASCGELSQSKSSKPNEPDCAFKAARNLFRGKTNYSCPHSFTYFSILIKDRSNPFAAVTVGPIISGKRESDEVYKTICRVQNLDEEMFLDRIQEIRIFSHSGIRGVIDFLKELTDQFLNLVRQKHELANAAFLKAESD